MKRLAVALLSLAPFACDNSDLTSEYGKDGVAGAAGATAGAAGSATSGSGGVAGSAGKAGTGGAAGGGTAGTGGAGAAGAAGAAGKGGSGGSSGAAGAAGSAGKGGGAGAGASAGTGGAGSAGKGGSSGAGNGGTGGGNGGTTTGGQGGAGTGGAGAGGAGAGGAGTGGATGGSAGAAGSGPPVCGNGVKEAGEDCDEGSGILKNACYPTCTTSVPLVDGSYVPETGDVLSPERGYADDLGLTAPGEDYLYVRGDGNTLSFADVELTAYANKDLDDVILGKLQTGFDAVRKARIKIILRFMYNDGTTSADASKAQILTHIQQLKPLLIKNADVILMMNAGFIGEYGGWYNSSHGLDNETDQKDVLLAILGALPTSRSVVVQRPSYKEAFFPGGPTSPAAAHDGSNKSRTGHHDACYLASPDDFGTYVPPVAQWMDYVAKDTQYVPMQGAMCALNPPRTDCGPAQAETAAHHFTTMSGYYAKSVIDAWKAGGCYDTIRKNLGYRFELTSASYSNAVRPGSALGLRVHIVNKGYSAPINARPFKVVLTNGANRMIADVPGIDVRTWAPGQDVSLDLWFRVPAGLAPGKYELALFLPDEAPSIAAVPEYAIRIADQGIFNVFTGDNTLGTVTVDGSTPGGIDPSATTFAYLPP